ncbi:MAG: DUF1822 family protein [Elainella sp. Prado103]|nr:DUF1822 family protein [Elainella sp. Prado103]
MTLSASEPEYGLLLPSDTISLTDTEVDWAKQQSQRVSPTAAPWQIYLNGLARIGLQHWLEKRTPELLDQTALSLPVSVDELCEMTIGNYRLYLLATDTVDDSEVPITHGAVSTSFQPHFYVLVEVFEELQQVRVGGYLPQAQIAAFWQSQRPNPVPSQAAFAEVSNDPAGWLSVTDFDLNIDRLLLQLTCLEPEATTVSNPTTRSRMATAANLATNAARWLTNQLDQIAEEWAWVLLPPSTSLAMRSLRFSSAQLGEVMTDLINRGKIAVPPQVGHVYRDIQIHEMMLRLYAVTWELPNGNAPSDWMLLLILGTPAGARIPPDVRLQVRDETQVLADLTLEDNPNNYLYVQVRGEQNESFYITISYRDQQVNLSPITFAMEVE